MTISTAKSQLYQLLETVGWQSRYYYQVNFSLAFDALSRGTTEKLCLRTTRLVPEARVLR
ncbi:hypothetical protein QC763_105465 [Podospora pseudopauciseta]|uniref:Uncharacterized protein n=2 Tax=Podospora TaxID=5144 RepID=A0ABR0HXR3_9PEZI|nr:hypothetical protein QC763_105465 [Podospora pseudopauciseta]KAK4681206.1 hypothetical protein QC764_105465 [Podospora pseudoanserina]